MDDDPANFLSSNGRGLSIVEEPDLRRIASYWMTKRGDRQMPERGDIDPTEIPWALSRLFIADYERDADVYRYRLAGNEIEAVFRKYLGHSSMRGATFQDILPPDNATWVVNRWRPLDQRGDIVYMRGLVYLAAESAAVGARLLLPLGADGNGLPTGVVGYTEYRWLEANKPDPLPGIDVISIPLAEIGNYDTALDGNENAVA